MEDSIVARQTDRQIYTKQEVRKSTLEKRENSPGSVLSASAKSPITNSLFERRSNCVNRMQMRIRYS